MLLPQEQDATAGGGEKITKESQADAEVPRGWFFLEKENGEAGRRG